MLRDIHSEPGLPVLARRPEILGDWPQVNINLLRTKWRVRIVPCLFPWLSVIPFSPLSIGHLQYMVPMFLFGIVFFVSKPLAIRP